MAKNKSNSKSNNVGGNTNSKRNRNRNRNGNRSRGKEFEVNMSDKDVNAADLRSMQSGGKDDNDVAWYAHSAALLRDSASIPFANPVGTRLRMGGPSTVDGQNPYTVPGILALEWSPTIGVSSTQLDGASIAANEQFSFIRASLSGDPTFEAPDLMMYELAVDSNCIWFSKLVRLYGTLNLNPVDNRYQPRALVEAQGFDYDSLVGRLADLRYAINHYAFQLGRVCVPADISYITRHAWMENSVYLDSNTSKAQMYLYKSIGCYTYREKDEGKPGYLKYQTYQQLAKGAEYTAEDEGQLMNIDDILAINNALFMPIMMCEDFDNIAGVIKRAYGMDRLIKFGTVDENYIVAPVFNQEVLMQIENSTAVGYPLVGSGITDQSDEYTWDITQNVNIESSAAGSIEQHPWVFMATSTIPSDKWNGKLPNVRDWYASVPLTSVALSMTRQIVNMHVDNPSPEHTMVATRLKSVINSWKGITWLNETTGNGSAYIAEIYTCGSEIVHAYCIYTLQYSQGTSMQSTVSLSRVKFNSWITNSTDMPSATTIDGTGLYILTMLTAFDWHPLLYITNTAPYKFPTNSEQAQFYGAFGDINNITVIDKITMERINDVALYSMFMSPLAANGMPRQ